MPAGLQYSAAEVNAQVGSLVRELNVVLTNLHNLRLWYLALGPGGLTQLPYQMVAGDDANIASALADAESLYQVFNNNGTVLVAKDFTAFMRRLWGYGY